MEVRLTAGAGGGVCEHGAKKVSKAGNSDDKRGRPVLGSVK